MDKSNVAVGSVHPAGSEQQQTRIKQGSKIPLRVPCCRNITSTKLSVANKKPVMKMNVIKPIITKRSSVPFKEFNITKSGTKPVVKRKSIGKKSKVEKKVTLRQSTLSKNFCVIQNKTKDLRYKSTLQTGKENSLPEIRISISQPEKLKAEPISNSEKKTLVEMQAEMNINFEPSEFYRNQILNEQRLSLSGVKPFTPIQEKSPKVLDPYEVAMAEIKRLSMSKTKSPSEMNVNFEPSEFYRNQILNGQRLSISDVKPFTPIQEKTNRSTLDPAQIALERFKRWSLSKHPRGSSPSSPKKNLRLFNREFSSCRKVESLRKNVLLEQAERRCTWAPGGLTKSPKVLDPYEVAMAQIKRLSMSKTKSPSAKNILEVVSKIGSPDKPMSAYEVAMQKLKALKNSRAARRKFFSPVALTDIKPVKEAAFVCSSPKLRARETTSICSNLIPEPATPLMASPICRTNVSTVYRPLQTLQANSVTRLNVVKHRLTDISEHSETENSSTLLRSLSLRDTNLSTGRDSTEDFVVSPPSVTVENSLPCHASSSVTLASLSEENECQPARSPENITPFASTYSSTFTSSSTALFGSKTVSVDSHTRPVCSPMVCQNTTRLYGDKNELNSAKLSLDFQKDGFSKRDLLACASIKGNFYPDELVSEDCIMEEVSEEEEMERLADEECASILASQRIMYSNCRKYLLNPVAVILSKGDRMNFLPIQTHI